MKKRTIVGLSAAAVILGVAVGVNGGSDTDTPERHARSGEAVKSASAEPEAAPWADDPGPATTFSDGTYLVGEKEDIFPGTYRTDGTDTGIGCYWERAKDDSGTLDSIITNSYSDGPDRVTVNAGEIFKVSGDCEWRRVG